MNRERPGRIERFYELIPITAALADDPATAEVVQSYEARLGTELEEQVAATTEPLDAESIRLRAAETNAGDFVADAVRASAGADVAIMNGGSIRGDRIYPAGPITRRTLVDIHPFGNVVCKIELPGRVLLQALESGVSKLPATAGQFPQISGMTMEIDRSAPPGHRVSNVRIDGAPLEIERRYTLAVPDYILKGGDDYSMFAGQRVLVGPEAGGLLVTALENYVAAAGTISPKIDGRIRIK
jgi:2',3'-cyclic-nucleotide 2'-phosphodiesterase (5'-nucleotidase family)